MRILATLTALLFFTLSTTQAQEDSDCTIDLSAAISTLAEAQVDAAEDTEAALAKIKQARERLEAIERECEEAQESSLNSVPLNALYEDPDELFTFNYPARWDVNALEPEGDESGRSVIVTNRDMETTPPLHEEPLSSGQRVLLVSIGPASFFGIDDVEGENISLDERLAGNIVSMDTEPIPADDIETFTLNQYRAAGATYIGEEVAQYFVVVEVEYDEQYIIVMGAATPDELDELQTLVRAVTQTVQINDEG